jgi:hypothetical protein
MHVRWEAVMNYPKDFAELNVNTAVQPIRQVFQPVLPVGPQWVPFNLPLANIVVISSQSM